MQTKPSLLFGQASQPDEYESPSNLLKFSCKMGTIPDHNQDTGTKVRPL